MATFSSAFASTSTSSLSSSNVISNLSSSHLPKTSPLISSSNADTEFQNATTTVWFLGNFSYAQNSTICNNYVLYSCESALPYTSIATSFIFSGSILGLFIIYAIHPIWAGLKANYITPLFASCCQCGSKDKPSDFNVAVETSTNVRNDVIMPDRAVARLSSHHNVQNSPIPINASRFGESPYFEAQPLGQNPYSAAQTGGFSQNHLPLSSGMIWHHTSQPIPQYLAQSRDPSPYYISVNPGPFTVEMDSYGIAQSGVPGQDYVAHPQAVGTDCTIQFPETERRASEQPASAPGDDGQRFEPASSGDLLQSVGLLLLTMGEKASGISVLLASPTPYTSLLFCVDAAVLIYSVFSVKYVPGSGLYNNAFTIASRFGCVGCPQNCKLKTVARALSQRDLGMPLGDHGSGERQ